MAVVRFGPSTDFLLVAAGALCCALALWMPSLDTSQAVISREIPFAAGPANVPPQLLRSTKQSRRPSVVAVGSGGEIVLVNTTGSVQSTSLAPQGIIAGRRPVALAVGRDGDEDRIVVMTDGWVIVALDKHLETVWETPGNWTFSPHYQRPPAPIEATIIVSDALQGRVFVSAREGAEKKLRFASLDLRTGAEVWQELGEEVSEQDEDPEVKWYSGMGHKSKGEVDWKCYSTAVTREFPFLWNSPRDSSLGVRHFWKERDSPVSLDVLQGKPNALVSKTSTGMEVLHLHNGRLLTRYPLKAHRAYGDFTADRVIESISVSGVGCTVTGASGVEVIWQRKLCGEDEANVVSDVAALYRARKSNNLRTVVVFDNVIYCLNVYSGKTVWRSTFPALELQVDDSKDLSLVAQPLFSKDRELKWLALLSSGEVDIVDVVNGVILLSVSLPPQKSSPPCAVDAAGDGEDVGVVVFIESKMYEISVRRNRLSDSMSTALLAALTTAFVSLVCAFTLAAKESKQL
mmetsp:Transcript_6349/g.19188  ORF Transcript_6349/g.19188 Transcript_6349/m.19188 type:complete len:517 (+) Transcript_6349:258-1808(+)